MIEIGRSLAATDQLGPENTVSSRSTNQHPEAGDPHQQRETAQVEERHEVRLRTSIHNVAGFAQARVENLSRCGLFIGGTTSLSVGQRISLELELPGSWGWFTLGVVVVHKEVRHIGGRDRAGFGCMVFRSQKGFEEALDAYLALLKRRKTAPVLIDPQDPSYSLLDTAGYPLVQMPHARLVPDIVRQLRPLAMIVPLSDPQGIVNALPAGRRDYSVLLLRSETPSMELLHRLDLELRTR